MGTESQKWRLHGRLSAGRGGRIGEKVQGIRSINGRYKIDRGGWVVQNSMGNVEAKERICTTHRRELRGGNAGGRGVQDRGD